VGGGRTSGSSPGAPNFRTMSRRSRPPWRRPPGTGQNSQNRSKLVKNSQKSPRRCASRKGGARLVVVHGIDAQLLRAPAAPRPPSRTKWTRRVPHPVLIGHAASLTPY